MSRPLDECRATLARIDTKLNDLIRSERDYRLSSCEIVTDDDLNKGERVYRLSNVIQPPLDLSIDVTEIGCLMRTVLDHLIYKLVLIVNGGSLPSGLREESISFPTVNNLGKIDETKVPNSLYGLSTAHWQWIKAVQQDVRPGAIEWPLFVLNKLVKVSKHRFHNTLVGVVPKVFGSVGTSEIPKAFMSDVCIFCRVQTSRFRAAHICKPEFKDGEPVFRVVPEKASTHWPLSPGSDQTLMAGLTSRFDSPEAAKARAIDLAASITGLRWPQADWDAFLGDLQVKPEVTQKILFGPGDPDTESLPIIETVQAIRDYLHSHVFADSGVIAGL